MASWHLGFRPFFLAGAAGDGIPRRLGMAALAFAPVTAALGLLLRWQLAGWSGPWGALDLRRAHSHLGFYGLLFPLAWLAMSRGPARVPGRGLLAFYLAMAAGSGVGFLWQGYGAVSIAASTGVLAVWLLFAWENRAAAALLRRDWLATSTPSVLICSALIGAVAAVSRADPATAAQLARAFLSLLLFGVFAPAALRGFGAKAPLPGPWLLAAVLGSLSLSGLARGLVFSAGLAWIGGAVLFPMLGRWRHLEPARRRAGLHWIFLSAALIATGSGLAPHSRPVAIAGVHYFVLGPLLMSFASAHRRALSLSPAVERVYELSLLGMAGFIAAQDAPGVPQHGLQLGAAACGSFLSASIAWVSLRAALGARSAGTFGARSMLKTHLSVDRPA